KPLEDVVAIADLPGELKGRVGCVLLAARGRGDQHEVRLEGRIKPVADLVSVPGREGRTPQPHGEVEQRLLYIRTTRGPLRYIAYESGDFQGGAFRLRFGDRLDDPRRRGRFVGFFFG